MSCWIYCPGVFVHASFSAEAIHFQENSKIPIFQWVSRPTDGHSANQLSNESATVTSSFNATSWFSMISHCPFARWECVCTCVCVRVCKCESFTVTVYSNRSGRKRCEGLACQCSRHTPGAPRPLRAKCNSHPPMAQATESLESYCSRQPSSSHFAPFKHSRNAPTCGRRSTRKGTRSV